MIVRVEKGHVTEEELAAVITVLLRAVAAERRPAGDRRPREAANWRWQEHRVGRCDPRSWRAVALA